MEQLLAIPNLSSSRVFPVDPWNHPEVIPNTAKLTKPEFIRYCQQPTTEGCHFSAAEGLDPMQRIGKENPATFLRGLVVDYDAKCTEAMISDLTKNSPTEYLPNWASSTFSGGARLVWLFESPLTLPGPAVTKSFLKHISGKLKLSKILPGLDVDALTDVGRYYERGRVWRNICNDRIPTNMVHQWMFETGNKIQWKHHSNIVIPIDKVAARVHELFPGKWEGPFEEGHRGARFWDESADNTTAAVIRSTGMQCFTGDMGFVQWYQILGTEFVQQFEAERTGEITAEMFYDGRAYWRKIGDVWTMVSKDDMRLMLKVKYGLSSTTGKKDAFSELERTLYSVQENKAVVAALPFVHFPSGILYQQGERYLNTSSARCLEPASKCEAFGDGFPWIAEFLTTFFADAKQLDTFMAWWKHFYSNALAQTPAAGHALFVAGDTGRGKTFLSSALLSRSVGGHIDASAYLLGEERFTDYVLRSPIMAVDDTSPASDARKHSRYSAMIKKIVANRYHVFEAKYMTAGRVDWRGRVVVTCNLDPESIRLLPNVEMSILDKIIILRCGEIATKFPNDREMNAILSEEMPFVCRYLLDLEPDSEYLGESRLGVKAYHDPYLYQEALHSGTSNAFAELLHMFLTHYKQYAETQGLAFWEGTGTQLLADMTECGSIGGLASKYTPSQVASLLGQLKSRGFDLERQRTSTQRKWRIHFQLLENIDAQTKD